MCTVLLVQTIQLYAQQQCQYADNNNLYQPAIKSFFFMFEKLFLLSKLEPFYHNVKYKSFKNSHKVVRIWLLLKLSRVIS